MGALLAADGRLQTGLNATYVGEFATYFHAMESALATAFPLIGFDLSVRSTTSHATHHVNRIQIGNVIDTQRRRRDTLIEAYATAAI
jgi:hypothetical protein